MREPALDLDEYLAGVQLLQSGELALGAILAENEEFCAEIGDFDPIKLASCFAGLLTVPELQSSCVRLEVLVHLALGLGRGQRKPTDKTVSCLFSKLGEGIAGRAEDPAEDVFVSSVGTPRGNFRILEGIWESGGFYLQRFINAVERIPSGARYDHMRECMYALLRLSDLVCERADLVRYQLGNENPVGALPTRLLASVGSLRRVVKFSAADLAANGISLDYLAEFGFDGRARDGLVTETIGHSALERYPIVHRRGEFFFLLPTAVSAAIRRYIIEVMDTPALRKAFSGTLAAEYGRLFSNTPLLGGEGTAVIEFQRTDNAFLAGVMRDVDHGLYLNFVFLVDPLEGFDALGLMGANAEPAKLGSDIDHWINEAYQHARHNPNFCEFLTLIVGCGVGRATAASFSGDVRENCRIEMISAPDLLTLSWVPDFKPLSLWRLLAGHDKLAKLGVSLQNMNGLLNLVAWARTLDGHLVPHGQLPEHYGTGDTAVFMMIEQNALRRLRNEVAVQWDAHVALDVQGQWVSVRRDGLALFEQDRRERFYYAEERRQGRWPRGLFETDRRGWWCEIETAESTSGHWAYERLKMIKTWVCRTAPVLEAVLNGLPKRPVQLTVEFEGQLGDFASGEERRLSTFEEARASISVSVDSTQATVSLGIGPRFERAIFHPENIAERALVECIVEGFATLAGQSLQRPDRDLLVNKVVPDPRARQSHAFFARTFRDFVRDSIDRHPTAISRDDGAVVKLGLGWRVRDRAKGAEIRGKEECTAFLNDVVRLLEDDLCGLLRQFNRECAIVSALSNHESAISERDNWARTAGAVLSLHDDKDATLQAMAEQDFKLNAVFQATRMLIEFAICECPMRTGRELGEWDLSRLMTLMMTIFEFGGWSDTIRWDASEPFIRITPLGDIHGSFKFHDEVLAPYSRATSDLRVHDHVEAYAENLEEAKVHLTDLSVAAPEFWEALEEEFGAPVDDVRKFTDFVESLGLEANQAILKLHRSALLGATFEGRPINPATTVTLIKYLTFESRSSWRDVPKGYLEKDRHPWRFRRRLSVLRKPLIQIDDADDPTIIVAPGLLRDAIAYAVNNFHRGDFPLSQLQPKMKRWAGTSRDRIGREFTLSVARRLDELGWKTETEVRITKLLQKGFEKNYGDVDVLAWNSATGRVLIIECKDVQYRKTEGEIAEQLADFRGETRADGKPDLLLRHVNRYELITRHLPELTKYIGIGCTPQVESHLVFKNPVPMQYVRERMKEYATLHIFAGLDEI